MALSNQMEMFEDGGLKDEGGMVDEVSGNDVPIGSTREEVRDDIPAQLSEGEFVFPADVVRFMGLEKLMMMRQKAKEGLKKMEAMGQMGNSDEATMPDDMPFDINDLDMEEESVDNVEETEYNRGGVIKAAVGTYVAPSTNVYDPTKNVYGGTTNTVPETYMPAKDILNSPNADNKFGLGAQEGVDSEMFEERRYVNEATGQVRMVSFNKATGQTTTNIKQLLDQGFVRKDEAVKEAAKAATPTGYRPRPQEQDDGQSSYDEQQKEEEMYGLGAGRISLGGSKDVAKTNRLGGEVRGGFLTKGSTTFGISFAKPGKDKFSLGKGLAGAALGKLGGFAVSAAEAITYGLGNIPEGGTAKFTVNGVSIVKPAEVANAILKNPMGAEARALIEQHKDMMKERDALVKSDKTLTSKEASRIISELTAIQDDPSAAVDGGEETYDYGTMTKEQSDASNYYKTTSSDDSDVGDSIDTESDYSDSSGGGYTDSAGVGVGAKGGFFTKSKMTKQKPKKMKRGGLASRK